MESEIASVAPPAGKGRSGRGKGFIVGIVGLLGGALIAGAAIANAATPSPSPAANQPGSASFDPTKGGHVGANGVVEKLLTGTTADKAKAALEAAGATVTVK